MTDSIYLRRDKGVALDHDEVDSNFLSFYHSASYSGSSIYFFHSQSHENTGSSGSIFEIPLNRSYGTDGTVAFFKDTGSIIIVTGSDNLRYNADTADFNVTGSVTSNGVVSAVGGDSTDWNEAFSWGNHSEVGYIQEANLGKVGILTSSVVSYLNDTTFKVSGGFVELADNINISGSLSIAGSNSITGSVSLGGIVYDSLGIRGYESSTPTGSYLRATANGVEWTSPFTYETGSVTVTVSGSDGVSGSTSFLLSETETDITAILQHTGTSTLNGTYAGSVINSLTVDEFGHVIELGSGSFPITGTGTTGRLAAWSGTTELSDSNVRISGDNVGIGGIESGYLFSVPGDSSYFFSITADTISANSFSGAFSGDGTNVINVTPKSGSVSYYTVGDDLNSRQNVASTNVNWSLGAVFSKTLTSNTALTFSSLQLNKIITLIVTGNYTLGFPSYCKKISGEYDGTVSNYIQLHCTNANSPYEVWYTINTEEI